MSDMLADLGAEKKEAEKKFGGEKKKKVQKLESRRKNKLSSGAH